MYCTECKIEMMPKCSIVTSITVLYSQIDYVEQRLYQCPKCKNVEVD